MDKKATIYTLAKETNMSVSAVSRAFDPDSHLKEEKRRIILEAAQKYNFVPNMMASRLSKKQIRIGVLIYGSIKAFYDEQISGIQDAHRRLSDYKVSCDLKVLDRSEHSADDLNRALDDLLASKPDGVIVSGIYSGEAINKIKAFSAAGIKVVCLTSDIPGSKRLFCSMSNPEEIASIAAQLFDLFGCSSANKNVAIFSGNMSSSNQFRIASVFTQKMMEYGIGFAGNFDTMNDASLAEQYIKNLLRHPDDVTGIFVSSANGLPICKYIEENRLQDRITLITLDTYPELKQYLQNGTVKATLYQDPFTQAQSSFDQLFHNLAHNHTPRDIIYSSCQIVMKSNLDRFF